jgi:hypothetical protein
MEQKDRAYFAQRAAEEQELAVRASNDAAAACTARCSGLTWSVLWSAIGRQSRWGTSAKRRRAFPAPASQPQARVAQQSVPSC